MQEAWAPCVDKGAGNARELHCEQVTARCGVQAEVNALGHFSAATDSEEEIEVAPCNPRSLYCGMLGFGNDAGQDARGMYLSRHLLTVYNCHRAEEGMGLCVEESGLCDRNLLAGENVRLVQDLGMSQCCLDGQCNL